MQMNQTQTYNHKNKKTKSPPFLPLSCSSLFLLYNSPLNSLMKSSYLSEDALGFAAAPGPADDLPTPGRATGATVRGRMSPAEEEEGGVGGKGERKGW
jgi:hypothetical protein